MPHRAHRSAGLIRSLTLLWTFVLASGAILAAGALVLSSLLGQSFREQVLDDNAREGSLFSNAVLTPTLVRRNRIVMTPGARRRLARAVRETEFTGISVWSRSGKLLYATPSIRRPERVRDESV